MFYSSTNTENLYHDFHNNIKQQKLFSTLIIIITIINNWELIVSMVPYQSVTFDVTSEWLTNGISPESPITFEC